MATANNTGMEGNQALTNTNKDENNTTVAGSKRKADELSTSSSSGPVDYAKYTWLRYFDPNSVKHYYFNSSTGVTQWDFPVRKVKPAEEKTDKQEDKTAPSTEETGDEKEAQKKLSSENSETPTEVTYIDEIEPIVYDGTTGELLTTQHLQQQTPVYANLFMNPYAGVLPQQPTAYTDYTMKASFNSSTGRFAAADGTYWDKMGLPNDRDGRQLGRFMDLNTLQQNRDDVHATRVRQ